MPKRRRRWQAPNNPTPQAKAVWAALYPREPWPSGWRVEWVGFMRGALGLTVYREKRILLSWGDARRKSNEKGPVGTLLHEFVHVRNKRLRHGEEFRRIENSMRARLGLDPLPKPAPGPARHRHRYQLHHGPDAGAKRLVWTYVCQATRHEDGQVCGEVRYEFQRRLDWEGLVPGRQSA